MKLLRVAAALLSVGAALFANTNANTNTNADVGTTAPRLLRHVRRILTSQADDQAACDAAFNTNPLKSYLSALPTDAGLRNCAASNINLLAAPLSAPGAKCSLASLVTLFSGSDPSMAVFTEFFNALVAGLASASASGASNTNTNTDLLALLASWTSPSSTKNEVFCQAMNDMIGPCAEVLLPAFVAILDGKGPCCSQLVTLYEVLKLVVPQGKTLDQTLVAIVNGLHASMCTTTTTNGFCGQSLLAYLATVVKTRSSSSSSSLLVPLVVDAGLPLFALPDGRQACSALDATSFPSRVAANEVAYTDLSCCAVGYVSLLQSVDDVVTHVTGDSFADTLNVIAGLQDAATASKFVSPYAAINACTFTQKTCTKPTFTLTATAGRVKVTENSPKNAKPQQIQCTLVERCDQDKVCSSVCREGTVEIAPWVARAIAHQRNLAYEHPLCFTQLPGTHNTGTTLARGWGNRDQLMNKVLDPANAGSFMRTANQFFTVTDQLNLGARFVEMDVHYFGKTIRDGHCSNVNFDLLQDVGAALVRTTQALLDVEAVEWQPSLMGCLPSLGGIKAANTRAHADTVKEITAWVQANPNDLVIVYLDVGSEVKTFDKYDEMLALYTAAFGDLLFSPADLAKAGGSWKSFTLSSLVEQGKRMVVVANEGSEVAFEMKKLCDGFSNVPGGKTGGGAGTIWGKKTNTGALVRAYTSVLHYATMAEDEVDDSTIVGTASEPATVEASTLPAFVNAGVNILAPDGLDGAVMQGMVWSWAAKEPSRGDTAVEISAKDGRWYGVADASNLQNVACVSTSNRLSWQIVSQGSSCPSGFVAGAPKLAVENVALTTALRTTGAEATAQLEVDLTTFPVISAEEEAAFDDVTNRGGSPGLASSNGVDQLSTSVLAGLVAALAVVAMH